MEHESRNIYRNARRVSGMTQERWAEAVGVSADSVINYEAGRQVPSDEVVRCMCEVSGYAVLGYQHLVQKSALANDILPAVERVPLPQAVCSLLWEIQRFSDKERGMQLLAMAADGRIDKLEQKDYNEILAELDGIVGAAMSLKYAEGGTT